LAAEAGRDAKTGRRLVPPALDAFCIGHWMPGLGLGGGKAHESRSRRHPSSPEIHLIQVKTEVH
jgi:hypothetical protein